MKIFGKELKICFETSDYEGKSFVGNIFFILDKGRGYYGIEFSTDDSEIKYGPVSCINSGVEYDNHYFKRTFYIWCFYHRHPNWDKSHKPRLLNFSKYIVKVPIDV